MLPRLLHPGNQRDSADYLYDTREFIALSGKKYHKKRNHIAQFAKYGAVFSEMTPADFDECIAFAANSYNQRDGYTDASSVAEQFAIHTFFTNFAALGLKGGVLRIAGKLAAFSIGEPISRSVFGVHIEKADIQYHGAYPAWRSSLPPILRRITLPEPRRGSGHSGAAQVQAVLPSGAAAGKVDGDLPDTGTALMKACFASFSIQKKYGTSTEHERKGYHDLCFSCKRI